MRRPVRVLLLLLIVAAVVGLGTVWRFWWAEGPLARPATVTIADGSTIITASRQLERAGAIRSADWFRRLATRLGAHDPIKAGEFELPAHASASRILDILQHGQPVRRLINVPEGMPSVLVAEKLAAEPLLAGPVTVPAEGSVLPDSYSFERGEARAAVLKRMQAAMDKELAALWAKRRPDTVVKTPREAIILASVVEKETGVAAERPMVAAVYANRLRLGMPLQADPTVIYPITRGKPLGRRIRVSELRAKNGYNTYAEPGLPAGPIANPGRDSIAAVLAPADSKALYFVANGKGGHVFADTLAEHNANVAKWYAIRRSRGEM
ncbi:endolytic transglycosylase MltG [Sphingomonas quercus]|uniref:Endolytic murein transglycosylase n=1 Tax=Sphingomonas quercus TaxID=2842451 RepID=A0ABS6BNF5_9SPHN|nr:endolytic transglycosylase MltG [Sphingomonas quercus]MBU3078921.1 endolytic transglycosylase MltG [Sphingomonas quercus]